MDLQLRLAALESQRDGFTATIEIPLADGTMETISALTQVDPLVVHVFDDDDVVTPTDLREAMKGVKQKLRHTVDGEEVYVTYSDSSATNTTKPGTDEVISWSTHTVCHCNKRAPRKPRKVNAAHDNDVVVPQELNFVRTFKVAEAFTLAQTAAITVAQGETAALIGSGRVRGSNAYKLSKVLTQRLQQCGRPEHVQVVEHMHKDGLMAELKRLAPEVKPKKSWKRKTLHDAVVRARKKLSFSTQSVNPTTAAADMLQSLSKDWTDGLTKQLRYVYFRQLTDIPPSTACQRGIDAEPVLLGRIIKSGLPVYDSQTKQTVNATLTNPVFQSLLIPEDNSAIAARTDMTADAVTPDGRFICRIAVEVKHLEKIAPVYDEIPEKYRIQIQTQIRASGTERNPKVVMYYVQGHAADEVGDWGSTCRLTILQIKPDFEVHNWIDFYCRLGQCLLRKLDSELFDHPMLTRPVTILDDIIKRTTFSKCVAKCGGTVGSFRYLDRDSLPAGSKFLNITPTLPKKSLVMLGKIDPNHPTHKTILCKEYRKVSFSEADLVQILLDTDDFEKTPTQIAKTYRCSLQQSKNAVDKAKKMAAKQNYDELQFMANSILASKGHTLENAVAKLHNEKGNNAVSLMCYTEAPETDPYAVDDQAQRWLVLTIDGASYDITHLTRTASQMAGSWSFAEHSVFAAGEDHGAPFGLQPMTDFSDFTLSPGHVLRADNLFWALNAEVFVAVTALERWCWDATFGVSKGAFAYLGATTSDAENGTVSVLHGLIRRQDEETFRVYMEIFAPLVYGVALRRHVLTCTDGCPRLTLISETLCHTPCHSDSHWHQRCRWHAVN